MALTAPTADSEASDACRKPATLATPPAATLLQVTDTQRRKLRALIRQDYRCCWCGEPLLLEEATREHIVPRALGGSNGFANMAVAHADCNNERGQDLNQDPHPGPVFDFIRIVLRSARRMPPVLFAHEPNLALLNRNNPPFTANWLKAHGYMAWNLPAPASAPGSRSRRRSPRQIAT